MEGPKIYWHTHSLADTQTDSIICPMLLTHWADNNNNNNNEIAVGFRLGLDLCVPHQCHCSSQVDARGLHSFVCKRAPGKSARHRALNDLIARSFASAGTPVTKEPVGMFRTWKLFLASVAVCNKTLAFSPSLIIQWIEVEWIWGPLIIGDEVMVIWFGETWNWKR